jgi:hypothetical protein
MPRRVGPCDALATAEKCQNCLRPQLKLNCKHRSMPENDPHGDACYEQQRDDYAWAAETPMAPRNRDRVEKTFSPGEMRIPSKRCRKVFGTVKSRINVDFSSDEDEAVTDNLISNVFVSHYICALMLHRSFVVCAQGKLIRLLRAHLRCSRCSQTVLMCVQLLNIPNDSDDPAVLVGWLQTVIHDLTAFKDHVAAVTQLVSGNCSHAGCRA